MSHLKSIGEKGPHLVIVPSSTLENWMREFSVFAPGLVTESYYGSQADRASQRYELKEAETLDVIVTTYNIATSSPEDQKFLRKSMKFNVRSFLPSPLLTGLARLPSSTRAISSRIPSPRSTRTSWGSRQSGAACSRARRSRTICRSSLYVARSTPRSLT